MEYPGVCTGPALHDLIPLNRSAQWHTDLTMIDRTDSGLGEMPRKETQFTSEQSPHHSTVQGVADRTLDVSHDIKAGLSPVATTTSCRQEDHEDDEDLSAVPTRLWVGIALKVCETQAVQVGVVWHDGTSSVDFAIHTVDFSHNEHEAAVRGLSIGGRTNVLEDFLANTLETIARDRACKFVGAGIAPEVIRACPKLPSRLWNELDILPVALDRDSNCGDVDEIADLMARKCVLCFGPNVQPRLQIGPLGEVGVDLGGRSTFVLPERYACTVGERTTRMANYYSQSLRRKHKKLAFFTSSSQGGVARMRYGLMRFLNCMEVDCSWFVPPPRPEVTRIHERVRQALRGEGDHDSPLPKAHMDTIDTWTHSIAESLRWTANGGPLAPRSRGGAAVIVIDDFTMPALVTISKSLDPLRPVILRSHHALRHDLMTAQGTCAGPLWQWIWSHIKHVDLFISEPLQTHVPRMIPSQKLALMSSSIDWLDGQNKRLSDEATAYYHQDFAHLCQRQGVPHLAYPRRDFIIQITDSDSQSAIQDAIAAFAHFRRQSRYCSGLSVQQTPQLLLCHDSSSAFTSKARSLDRIRTSLTRDYPDLASDIIISPLPPCDRTLNALLSRAHISLSLSHNPSHNALIAQSLHKGVTCIALHTPSNALHIQHTRSGFLIQAPDKTGQRREAAEYMDVLFGDDERYYDMGYCGRLGISDEISTVGEAVCWMYLFNRMTSERKPSFEGGWVWDMAREGAGERRRRADVERSRSVTIV
nr:hypothetical protein B0A51_06017 [Rachicladosporium sp. CCFEE 5018]